MLPLGEDLEFGYGLGIMDWTGWLGHAGAIFGYSTWMLHHPEKDATVVVLANRGETQQEFASAITACDPSNSPTIEGSSPAGPDA